MPDKVVQVECPPITCFGGGPAHLEVMESGSNQRFFSEANNHWSLGMSFRSPHIENAMPPSKKRLERFGIRALVN